MTFATAYSEKKPFYMESGSKFMDTYEYSIDEKGHKSLVKTGEKDIYIPIQESLESTLIENILQKAALGDPEALNRVNAHYLDLTNMPSTLAEAQNKIIQLKNDFNKLPIDIKRKFDFSAESYIHSIGSDYWFETMGYAKPEVKPETSSEIKSEVKENDNNE